MLVSDHWLDTSKSCKKTAKRHQSPRVSAIPCISNVNNVAAVWGRDLKNVLLQSVAHTQ